MWLYKVYLNCDLIQSKLIVNYTSFMNFIIKNIITHFWPKYLYRRKYIIFSNIYIYPSNNKLHCFTSFDLTRGFVQSLGTRLVH